MTLTACFIIQDEIFWHSLILCHLALDFHAGLVNESLMFHITLTLKVIYFLCIPDVCFV